MKTIEELIQIAENNGWNVDIDEKDYTFAQYSNAGQDFFFTITADTAEELITELSDYIEGYNPFDEALLWIRDGHGVNGAPYDAEDVYNDMKDCKQMMQELLDAWNEEGKAVIDIETAENELTTRVSKLDIQDAVYDFALNLIWEKVNEIEKENKVVDADGEPCTSNTNREVLWYDDARETCLALVFDKMKEFLEVV